MTQVLVASIVEDEAPPPAAQDDDDDDEEAANVVIGAKTDDTQVITPKVGVSEVICLFHT